MEDSDAQLQLKKRARRRLVGALAFVSVVAVVLPMLMDNEPRQYAQDIDIRIPGQEERHFVPAPTRQAAVSTNAVTPPVATADNIKTAEPVPEAKPAPVPDVPAVKPTAVVLSSATQASAEAGAEKPVEKPAVKEKAVEKSVDKSADKHAEKLVEKPAQKPGEKPAEKPAPAKVEKKAEKPAEKTPEKPKHEAESVRAAAILSGLASVPPTPPAKSSGGEFVIQIGAFANDDNVRQVRSKLGDAGVKSYTESLESAQGKKIRVRAGPFASREAAEKALEKMKRAGVSGTVTAKQ